MNGCGCGRTTAWRAENGATTHPTVPKELIDATLGDELVRHAQALSQRG